MRGRLGPTRREEPTCPPRFLAGIKGDVAGIGAPGEPSDRLAHRAQETPTAWTPTGLPVELYALGGLGTGVPVRATITSFGPVLLSKVLGLNATQLSSLRLVLHFADKAGLPLLDLKDLRVVISHPTSDEGKADLSSSAACRPRRASSCARSSRSRTRAATSSSASPSSTPPTCCARPPTAGASCR